MGIKKEPSIRAIIMGADLSKTSFWAGKWVITGCLFVFLLGMVKNTLKNFDQDKVDFLKDLFIHPPQAETKAKVRTLNHLIPSFDYLIELSQKKRSLDTEKLKEYVKYYEQVVEYLPQMAEAYSVLGFCYHYLGDDPKAIALFKTAVLLNPALIWAHYDMGVIYYNHGQYPQAVESLEKAIAIRPELILSWMKTSKIYQQLFSGEGDISERFGVNLRIIHRHSYALIMMSLYRQKNFPRMLKTALMAIPLNLDHLGLFYYLGGVAAYETGNYQKAIAWLKECIKQDPSWKEAYYYMGLSLEAMGKKQEAMIFLRKISQGQGLSQTPILRMQDIDVQVF